MIKAQSDIAIKVNENTCGVQLAQDHLNFEIPNPQKSTDFTDAQREENYLESKPDDDSPRLPFDEGQTPPQALDSDQKRTHFKQLPEKLNKRGAKELTKYEAKKNKREVEEVKQSNEIDNSAKVVEIDKKHPSIGRSIFSITRSCKNKPCSRVPGHCFKNRNRVEYVLRVCIFRGLRSGFRQATAGSKEDKAYDEDPILWMKRFLQDTLGIELQEYDALLGIYLKSMRLTDEQKELLEEVPLEFRTFLRDLQESASYDSIKYLFDNSPFFKSLWEVLLARGFLSCK